MRDEPERGLRCPTARYPRPHKGCWSIKTAGRWSWKSKSAKECVTTHLPNQLAPKMDGAEARDLYPAVGADLGGSSKYSNENFEGRRGERFHVNGTCTWVSRS